MSNKKLKIKNKWTRNNRDKRISLGLCIRGSCTRSIEKSCRMCRYHLNLMLLYQKKYVKRKILERVTGTQ